MCMPLTLALASAGVGTWLLASLAAPCRPHGWSRLGWPWGTCCCSAPPGGGPWAWQTVGAGHRAKEATPGPGHSLSGALTRGGSSVNSGEELQAAGSNFVPCFWVSWDFLVLIEVAPSCSNRGRCHWGGRCGGQGVLSRLPLPPSAPPLEIAHPGWPLAVPEPQAEVLGVGAGRREPERVLLGYGG